MISNIYFRFEGVDGAHLKEKKWSSLGDELNALGGAKKTGQEWRKYYLDQKNHLKEKKRQLLNQKSGINGKPLNPLNEYELRLSALISEESIIGDATQEFGLPQSASENQKNNDENELFDDCDISIQLDTSNVNMVNAKKKSNTVARTQIKKNRGNIKTTEDKICEIEMEKKDILQEKLNIKIKRLDIEERRILLEERRVQIEERRVAAEEKKVEAIQKIADFLSLLVPEYLVDHA